MRIYRTFDGRSFEISQPLTHFQSKDDLFDAMSLTTGISSDDIICMTKTGQQINDEVLDDMQDMSTRNANETTEFYVFHRQFLYTELDTLVGELSESPELEEPIVEAELAHPPTPRSLSSLTEWCQHILANITAHNTQSWERLEQLGVIHRSTAIALSNLVSHSGTVRDTARMLESTASRELTRMQGLLKGHETDLKILTLVHISPKLLNSSDQSKARSKERTLGDYVSPSKMGAVYQACSNVYNDLEENLRLLQHSESQMNDDTEGLRSEVYGTGIVPSQETYEESRQALSRATEIHAFICGNCMPDAQGWSAAAKLAQDEELMARVDEAAGELILLDEVARESVRRLTADRNDMMSRSLHLLSDISSLQSDYADLGIDLAQLDSDFKSSRVDGFRHLARLKNMLWAYGSTVIEIHRRSRFETMFMNRSQALAEVMATLTESERRRRGDFRGQVVGALPWEVKGMHGNTPSLEISAGKEKEEEEADIDQSDIDELFQTLDSVSKKLVDQGMSAPVEEVKVSLRLLVSKMDEAEAEFIKLVETGLLGKPEDDSDSENDSPNRIATHTEVNGNGSLLDKSKLERELQEMRTPHGEKERALAETHDQQMALIQIELSKIRSEHRHLEANLEQERHQHDEARKQLEGKMADAEVEAARRLSMEDELSRLRRDLEDARRAEVEAKAEIGEEVDRANELEAHLHDLQVELEEAKEARNDASHRIEALLNKDSSAERQLSLAQERIDELSNQLSLARVEERKAREAQSEIEQARDKVLRNYRVEADGDRAILEETLRSRTVELDEMKDQLRRKEREVGDHSDSVKNLQGQLAAADEAHEELVRQLEGSKEANLDAEMTKRQAERKIDAVVEKARPMMRRLVEMHNTLRDAPALTTSSSKAAVKSGPAPTIDAEQEQLESKKQEAIGNFQAAGDSATLEVIMELMNSFSRSGVLETAIAKLDSLPTLCKKWIRAYKHSNEKVVKQQTLLREKITFRNFGIGDLALFLPTKNNSGKPWAAFNINFPHFFLNFSGSRENEQLRDSLQNKEWIVARITKIESRVASAIREGEIESQSNPFQLSEGVKFFLLDVEGWNNVNSSVAPAAAAALPRRKSTNASVTVADASDSIATQSIPALKRWDSSPQAASVQNRDKARISVPEEDASEKVIDPPLITTPSTSPQDKKVQNSINLATLSTASPVAASPAKDRGDPGMTLSRASSPSGIALSLRNRSLSPEMSKTKSSNEIVEAGFTRWPTTSERQQLKASSNGRGDNRAEPSSTSSSLRRGGEKVTQPAFGRRKPIGSSLTAGGASVQASKNVNGNVASQQSIPVSVAKRSVAINDTPAEISPNPFSASPALPSVDTSEMKDYFATRRRTSSKLRPSPAEEAQSSGGRGSSAIEIEGVEGSRNRRTSSSSSVASGFRPRSLLASPGSRGVATLSPNTETAQGQHNLALQQSPPRQAQANDTSVNVIAPSPARGAFLHTNATASHVPTTIRRLPSSSSSSSWMPSWSLGRKAGTRASDDYRDSNGKGFEEGNLSASQSLRRLADAGE